MDPITEYAQMIAREDPLRVLGGVVVAADGAYVRVDIGGRAVTAYGSGRVGAPVRLLVGRGTCMVLGSSDVTAWTTPTLTGGWLDHLAGVAPTAYRKVGDTVELRGAVKSGSVGVPVFTLPAGFRPVGIEVFYAVAYPGGARIDVGTDGVVKVASYVSSGTNAIVSLAGISYSTI